MHPGDEEVMVWLAHWLHCDLSPSALGLSSSIFPAPLPTPAAQTCSVRRLTWFRVDTARRSHIKAHEQAHVSPVTFPPGFNPIMPRHRGTFGVVSQFACPPCGDGSQYSSAFLVFWSLGFRLLSPGGRPWSGRLASARKQRR